MYIWSLYVVLKVFLQENRGWTNDREKQHIVAMCTDKQIEFIMYKDKLIELLIAI